MKKFDLILRTAASWVGRRRSEGRDVAGEDSVHLSDRLREYLERAPAFELLHVLGGLEDEAKFHSRAALVLGELHPHRSSRQLGIGCPVVIGPSVGELERRRR